MSSWHGSDWSANGGSKEAARAVRRSSLGAEDARRQLMLADCRLAPTVRSLTHECSNALWVPTAESGNVDSDS